MVETIPQRHSAMGRPTKFLITKPHPTPQFRDKIKLLQFRRSPTDDRWDAIFFRDGKWQMRRPVALGTNDLTAAAEVARVKFTMSGKGQRPTREYTKPEPKKAPIRYPLSVYAKLAIKKLRDEADAADAIHWARATTSAPSPAASKMICCRAGAPLTLPS